MLKERPNILVEIFAHKRAEVEERRRVLPLELVRQASQSTPPPPDFLAALRRSPRPGEPRTPALIAEVKMRSPSRGLLAPAFDPLALARTYAENGAAAVSVLTDQRYFGGRLEHLRQIAAALPGLPLLRKDFVCDPYQVYEARAAGASALLLIVAGLSTGQLQELFTLACELGMVPLVEIHSPAELEIALGLKPPLVGINNRDLGDFTVRLETTIECVPLVPPGVCVVAESGIHTPQDVRRLASAGVDAILVGEALVTAPDVGSMVRLLAGRAEGRAP
jgi:indole-3-glycerol phosphate synthase